MKKRSSVLNGHTIMEVSGCGSVYITINNDEDGKPFEVFATMGKAGGCACAQLESIGRLLSWGLKSGGDIESAAKSLSGIQCNQTNIESGKFSCGDAISKALSKKLDAKLNCLVSENIK